MKLINQEIRKRFQEVGSQEFETDPLVVCKIFNPSGVGTWYCTELHENDILFGYVDLIEKEWGFVNLAELESIKCPPFNLPLELDLYCGEKPISEHCPELREQISRKQELQKIDNQKKRDNELEK